MSPRMGCGKVESKRGDPVWETCKVHKETNQSWFASFRLLTLPPTNLQNVSGHALPTYTPRKTCRSPTTPTLTPAATLQLVPATQLLTSICMDASMNTRNPRSSVGMFCNEVIGVPHHRLPQTNSNPG